MTQVAGAIITADGFVATDDGFTAGTGTMAVGDETVVGTGATTIHTQASAVSVAFVTGTDGTNEFCDLVAWGDGAALTAKVMSSQTIKGAPVARTYTVNPGGVLQLAMASGSYTVKTCPFAIA